MKALAHLIDEKHRDEPDRAMPCAVCGKPTRLDGFIVGVLKTWNDKATNAADFIRPSEVEITCDGECTAQLYTTKHTAYANECEETRNLLRMLLDGKYTPESLALLRRRGLGEYVNRQLAKEGTTGT